MTLQRYLTRLTWLAIVPVLALALGLSYLQFERAREDNHAEAKRLAAALARTLDQMLQGRMAGLQILSRSPLLEEGRWHDLYREALGFREAFGGHVILVDAERRMRLHTGVPFGGDLPPLPRPAGRAAVAMAFESAQPAVGDPFMGPIANESQVAIAVPAIREGRVAMVLVNVVPMRHLRSLLDSLPRPADWTVSLSDSGGRTVLGGDATGGGTGTDRSDDATLRFVNRPSAVPWTVEVQIPRATYVQHLAGVATILAVALLGVTLVSVLVGRWGKRRLVASIRSLTELSRPGQTAEPIDEIREARRLLDGALTEREATTRALHLREAQARAQVRYSEAIAQLGQLVVDSDDPQALMQSAPELARRALGGDAAVVFLLEPGGAEFRVAHPGSASGETFGPLVPNRPGTLPGWVLSTGQPVMVRDCATETRFALPDSYREKGLVSALGVPVTGHGHPVGVLAVCFKAARDFSAAEVTFLQSVSSLLSACVQRAEQADQLRHVQQLESVGQLAGGVAHDFNNLLTVIQGELRALGELPEIQAGAGRELVASAAQVCRHGAELAGRLLSFSRRQALLPRRVDLGELLHGLARMLRRVLDSRIEVVVDVKRPGLACRADPTQLESALLNLAINARDAMPDGGTLTLRAEAEEAGPGPDGDATRPGRGFVRVAVADTGCGMSEEVRKRAFEPFFTTKESGRGTGLGLASVLGFVQQSGGRLELRSAVGQGTTVTLALPACAEAAPTPAAAASAEKGALPPGLRVLLVDDAHEVALAVRAMLTRLQCSVTLCKDAGEALALLDGAQPFDMLLTDIRLGDGISGVDLARRVLRSHPRVAVLLMSGAVAEPMVFEDGAARRHLLPKPFTLDQLARSMIQARTTALDAREPDATVSPSPS